MKMRPQKLKDLAFNLLDPIIRRRTGLTFEVIENWPLIVGSDIALLCSPIKLKWPYVPAGSEEYKPATLLIACQGSTGIQVMHQNLQIIERINRFFGYHAIDKIKITQKHVDYNDAYSHIALKKAKIIKDTQLTVEKEAFLCDILKDIRDEALKKSLFEIGCSLYKELSTKRV